MSGYDAYRERTIVDLTLLVETPLHVGSGFDTVLNDGEAAVGPDGDDETRFTTVVLDASGRPYVPSTTLKGALRALFRAAFPTSETDVSGRATIEETLFGAIRATAPNVKGGTVAKGRPGRVVFSGAEYVDFDKAGRSIVNRIDLVGADGARLAQADRKVATVYGSRRTAIDPETGTPDRHKLYGLMLVPPGTRFKARMTLVGPEADPNWKESRAHLDCLLAAWKTDGIAIGRGKGDGQGRIRLASVDRVRVIKVDGGAVVERTEPVESILGGIAAAEPARPEGVRTWRLALRAEDAFFVTGFDDHSDLPKRKDRDGREEDVANVLRALRSEANGFPDLPGSSFMGALKAKLSWLAALEALREESKPGTAEWLVEFGTAERLIEVLFGKSAETIDNERRKGAAATGQAGRLRLVSITPRTSGKRSRRSSVRIDRFTMGPIDQGLFEVEAYEGPVFEVELALRPPSSGDAGAGTAFLARSFRTITDPEAVHGGLTLGHGGNRGFGWFDAEVMEEPS